MQLKEVIISEDAIALKNFKPEGIILKNTKLEVGKLVNIGGINFIINEIFFRIMGTLDVSTKENGLYTFENPNQNNFKAYKFYEKSGNI